MTDKEQWMETWVPTLGSREKAEEVWAIKKDRELNPIRSASVYVMPSYQSPVTGKWIDTPAQRRDDLARNNCRPWEGMEAEKKEAAIRTQEADRDMDRVAEKIAVDVWQSAPDSVKQLLS